MKYLFVGLLTFSLAACNPVSREDEEATPAVKSQATKRTATPTPAPQPGDWMEKKKSVRRLDIDSDPLKADPLKAKSIRVKGDRLDEKAK